MSNEVFYKLFNKKTNEYELTNKFNLFSSIGQIKVRINRLIAKDGYTSNDFILHKYKLEQC